jgi:hypothetical protein
MSFSQLSLVISHPVRLAWEGLRMNPDGREGAG